MDVYMNATCACLTSPRVSMRGEHPAHSQIARTQRIIPRILSCRFKGAAAYAGEGYARQRLRVNL